MPVTSVGCATRAIRPTGAEWALVQPVADPARRAGRPSPDGGRASGAERDLPRPLDRLPMDGAAEGPAAAEHGPGPPRPLGSGWHAGAPSPRAPRRGARAGGARGRSDAGRHRRPERQGRAKGGATLDPSGYDAGKKALGRKVLGRERHILVDTLGLLLSGLLLSVIVHPANVRDRGGARRPCCAGRAACSPSSSA